MKDHKNRLKRAMAKLETMKENSEQSQAQEKRIRMLLEQHTSKELKRMEDEENAAKEN